MATIIYDGDCDFCKKWVNWLKTQIRENFKITTFQGRPTESQKIPTAALERAVHLVDHDGTVQSGAAAIFRAMEMRPQGTPFFWLYNRFWPFKKACDLAYRFVADHRGFSAWVTYFLWGDEIPPARFQRVRRYFLAVLGFSYLAAFLSLSMQVKGLVGENGVLPIKAFLDWKIFGDTALVSSCIAGAVFSIFLMINLIPRISALACWILYFLLVIAGNVFLGYQWEELLLEAGFLAIFLAPSGFRPQRADTTQPRMVLVWLYRWLFFRLMFSSGLAKIILGDITWHNLTALNFHFETQPLPTFVSWYVAKFPETMLKSMTALTLFIETLIPLLFFLPRRPRIIAFWFQLLLQLAIILTGNYCYFNVLTIGLSLFLLDDHFFDKIWPIQSAEPLYRKISPWEYMKRSVLVVLTFIIVVSGVTRFKNIAFQGDSLWDRLTGGMADWSQRYFIVGSYGLFVNMTTERDEIIIEGSRDGNTWLPYEFPYKPGDLTRRPAFVAPYQPRLDWQAWFAALGDWPSQPWLQNLCVRLLQGQKEVLNLFKTNPFPDNPPQYLRVMLYHYQFSDRKTLKSSGQWWTRTLKGPYSPILSLNTKP